MAVHRLAYKAKSKKGEEDDKWGVVVQVILGLVVLLFVLAYIVPRPSTETSKFGVKVVSEIDLEDLKKTEFIALYNTTVTPAELTCKFELSAISKPDLNGYIVNIGTGDTGIYLKRKEATIKGATQSELLRACHVFACLREGVECPDFTALDGFFRDAKSVSIILDRNVDQKGGMGYAEVMGALSFMQTKKVDADKNGDIEQAEVDANDFFIYPFIKDGDVCQPQPMKNMIENWERTNETANCNDIAPAIIITPSNETSIRVVGGRVFVSGSGDPLHTALIVLRDFIDPEWVRRFHGLT